MSFAIAIAVVMPNETVYQSFEIKRKVNVFYFVFVVVAVVARETAKNREDDRTEWLVGWQGSGRAEERKMWAGSGEWKVL